VRYLHSVAEYDPERRVVFGIIKDITQRTLAEDALRKITVAVDQSPIMVVITDTEGCIEYVNPKFTEVTGFAAAEVLGRNPRLLNSGLLDAQVFRNLWSTIQSGRVWKGQLHNRKRGGECYWESATIAPVRDPAGRISHFVAIKEDISEFKRMEAARLESEARFRDLFENLEQRVKERTAELEFANREMESFSYSVSHDLRAPLRSIEGFSQALMEDCGDGLDATGREYLTHIQQGGRRMGALIDDLLKLSRTSRSELELCACDLSMLSTEVANVLARGASGNPVALSVQPGMWVRADPSLMRVVLENLLANAWKFTCKREDRRVWVGIEVSAQGEQRYFVRDNGVGFNMAYAGKLFKAFQRLHLASEFEGTGIGLAIVQRIIRRHGGRVWAEAEVGKGATFFFTLPG